MTTAIDVNVGERQWRKSIQDRFAEPQTLPVSTVAALNGAYPPEDWAYAIIAVSDGTSNKRLAISDGTDWRWPDGAVVS